MAGDHVAKGPPLPPARQRHPLCARRAPNPPTPAHPNHPSGAPPTRLRPLTRTPSLASAPADPAASMHAALVRAGRVDSDPSLAVIQVNRMGHKGYLAHDFPLCVDGPVWAELVSAVRAALAMPEAVPQSLRSS